MKVAVNRGGHPSKARNGHGCPRATCASWSTTAGACRSCSPRGRWTASSRRTRWRPRRSASRRACNWCCPRIARRTGSRLATTRALADDLDAWLAARTDRNDRRPARARHPRSRARSRRNRHPRRRVADPRRPAVCSMPEGSHPPRRLGLRSRSAREAEVPRARARRGGRVGSLTSRTCRWSVPRWVAKVVQKPFSRLARPAPRCAAAVAAGCLRRRSGPRSTAWTQGISRGAGRDPRQGVRRPRCGAPADASVPGSTPSRPPGSPGRCSPFRPRW